VLTFVYVVVSTIFFTTYNREFVGQVVILALLCFTFNFYFWVVMFKPIYDSLFHREQALATFYDRIGTSTASNPTNVTSKPMSPTTEYNYQQSAFDFPNYPRETYQRTPSPTYHFPDHNEYMFTPRQTSPPPPRPPPRRGNHI
jgi:hypothetical protein